MREVAVEDELENLAANRNLSSSDILADCEKRLLEVANNLSSRVCTFETVQWALRELQHLELLKPNSVSRGHPSKDEGESVQTAKEMRGTSARIEEKEKGSLQPRAIGDGEVKETVDAIRSVDNAVHRTGDSVTRGLSERTEDRDTQKDGSSRKRKVSEESSLANEMAERAKMRHKDGSAGELEDLLATADSGEAGKRMMERIKSKLAVSERTYLTNLVSHCLLVSFDQVSAETKNDHVASNSVSGPLPQGYKRDGISIDDAEARGSASNAAFGDDKVPCAGEWMWLLRWLARAILSDAGADGPFASLDWLVAFVIATHSSLIVSILDDLASDLSKREFEGSATLASYLRRVGVLEYAALRDPEQAFGKLRPLLPPARFPNPGRVRDDEETGESGVLIWQGWFGLMALCPRLCTVVSSFYVPVLSVDIIKSWRVQPATTKSLPAIWTMLLDSYEEEPETMKEWIYLAILRRIPELASVASNFVLLLGAISETSADQKPNNVANTLLMLLYKTLSTEILPKILGGAHDLHAGFLPDDKENGDVKDVSAFVNNLKQHCNLLWNKCLERFSVVTCTCCEIQRNDESVLESSSRTEHNSDNDGSGVHFEESGETFAMKGNDKSNFEFQRGCLFRDPVIRLCQLTLLCCSESAVANLLVNSSQLRPSAAGSFESPSLRGVLMVMRVMRIISGQGQQRLHDILDLWALQVTNRAAVAMTDEAVYIVLAMRELLDSNFWQSHERFLGYTRRPETMVSVPVKGGAGGQLGLSWKAVHRGVRRALGRCWLDITPLMHRDDAWDLKLAVLGVLQLLKPDATTRPQVIADRLKGALGLLFCWLEMRDNGESGTLNGGQTATASMLAIPNWRWHYARANEHLKSIIIELSASSLSSFTLMVNSLLDFSFDYSSRTFTKAMLSSESGRAVVVAPLSTGKLNRYGKLILTSALASELNMHDSPQAGNMRLAEENRRIQSGESRSDFKSQIVREFGGSDYGSHNSASSASTPAPESIRQHLLLRSKITNAELGSLLRRTLDRAIARSVELPDAWPFDPVNVLSTHLADRLETPHEVPMKMEQYEEVLPKYISSARHIFLTDCFSQYPLLMEMMELVVKHRGNPALRCVEFIRVLLADSISSWNGTFRPRWPLSLLQPKGEAEEAWNRMQASRLIQLVASAHWLPPPLAASGEIVGVIDGTDISDLLLLVWRCMHHSIAFGPRAWGESSSNLPAMEIQGISSPRSGADEDGSKEGTFTEWEGHLFAILRRNVSKIGAHFAQVYPVRKAF